MRDALAKLYTLDAANLEFVLTRRTVASPRLGARIFRKVLRLRGIRHIRTRP